LRTFFIVPAVENSTLWKSLDTLSEEQLDPRYVSQMNNLKNYLLETKPHSYFSHLPPFTGESYYYFLLIFIFILFFYFFF